MNIRVDLNYPILDGTEVVFRSPVDCSQVTGLKVYYKENGSAASKEFAFADAHGNNVGDIDHLFAENVVVKVILDVTTGMAFVQNADTNAYLEGRFADLEAQVQEKNGTAVSFSGYRYSDAEKSYDISANGDGSVIMYLYPTNGGYVAVVSGKGAIKNFEVDRHVYTGSIMKDGRPYADYAGKISRLYIEKGVTSIGDYFMFRVYRLKELVFEDSSGIKFLGLMCFGATQITGEFSFCNLAKNAGSVPEINRAFYACPNLQGITVGVDTEGDRLIRIAERTFYGCLNLRYFKVDKPLETDVHLGVGSFELCPNLEFLELQTGNTTPAGFNFVRCPVGEIMIKTQQSNGTLAINSVASTQEDSWNFERDEGGIRLAPILCNEERWILADNYAHFYDYLDCLNVPLEYGDKCHQWNVPESDNQGSDRYATYYDANGDLCNEDPDGRQMMFTHKISSPGSTFWGCIYGYGYDMTEGAKEMAVRIPTAGACWLFAYYHIWNVLHPHAQYHTVDEFIKNKIEQEQIKVDQDLHNILTGGTWDHYDLVMATGQYPDNYFDKDKLILATDLPVDLKYDDDHLIGGTTLGEKGTASWGVREVLGWTGERLTKDNKYTWAAIKKKAIDSIFNGMPFIFECVSSSATTNENYSGLHAVAAIGYDAKTDKFKIIDGAWGMNSDVVPEVYWATFESHLEPSQESAIWLFSRFDDGAIVTKAPEHWVDKIGAIDTALTDIINQQKALIGG